MNKIHILAAGLSALGVIAVAVAAWKTSRAGYETASYQTVLSDGPFEIRDYVSLTLIEAPMGPGAGDGDGNRSFGRLFGYITGKNSGQKKIAMTTPVFMTEREQEEAGSGAGDRSNRNMAFVMPATMTSEEPPQPADESLSVRTMPPTRYATYRFSGSRSSQRESDALERLRQWMKEQNHPALAAPIYGYFDPPWTPGVLRRNEVMIETKVED